jgi:hypothetical protein
LILIKKVILLHSYLYYTTNPKKLLTSSPQPLAAALFAKITDYSVVLPSERATSSAPQKTSPAAVEYFVNFKLTIGKLQLASL